MSSPGTHREVEIKLRLDSAAQGRRMLRRAGIPVKRRRLFGSNLVFDTPDLALRGRGALLRLRQSGAHCTLTYKGPASSGKHKSRDEAEVRLNAVEPAQQILAHLGLEMVFRYEKYRTEYGKAGWPGLILLDETPVGAFLELEGPPAWIDRTTRRLGFSESDYITLSYGRLYLEFCREQQLAPTHMVFA